jgi:hypothetical protein
MRPLDGKWGGDASIRAETGRKAARTGRDFLHLEMQRRTHGEIEPDESLISDSLDGVSEYIKDVNLSELSRDQKLRLSSKEVNYFDQSFIVHQLTADIKERFHHGVDQLWIGKSLSYIQKELGVSHETALVSFIRDPESWVLQTVIDAASKEHVAEALFADKLEYKAELSNVIGDYLVTTGESVFEAINNRGLGRRLAQSRDSLITRQAARFDANTSQLSDRFIRELKIDANADLMPGVVRSYMMSLKQNAQNLDKWLKDARNAAPLKRHIEDVYSLTKGSARNQFLSDVREFYAQRSPASHPPLPTTLIHRTNSGETLELDPSVIANWMKPEARYPVGQPIVRGDNRRGVNVFTLGMDGSPGLGVHGGAVESPKVIIADMKDGVPVEILAQSAAVLHASQSYWTSSHFGTTYLYRSPENTTNQHPVPIVYGGILPQDIAGVVETTGNVNKFVPNPNFAATPEEAEAFLQRAFIVIEDLPTFVLSTEVPRWLGADGSH